METGYQESLVRVHNIEEAAHKVHDDVEERLNDDVPNLHEPRAVEAVPLVHHDEEVEAGKEGSEDEEDNGDGAKTDIEEVVEEGTEIYLENIKNIHGKTQKQTFHVGILRGIDSVREGGLVDKR